MIRQSALICTPIELDLSDLDTLRKNLQELIGGSVNSFELVRSHTKPYNYIRFNANFSSNTHLFDFMLKYNVQHERRMKIMAKLDHHQITEYKNHCKKSQLLVKGFPLTLSFASILNKLDSFGVVSYTNLGNVHGNAISGIVQYSEPKSMKKASTWLNGSLLLKHRVNCVSALSPKANNFIPYFPNSTLLVSNLSPELSHFEIYELFLTHGQIESLQLSGEFAKITYFNKQDASEVMKHLSGYYIKHRKLSIIPYEDQDRVYIGNLAIDITKLIPKFRQIGPIKSFEKTTTNSKSGYIEFKNKHYKDQALLKLQSLKIDDKEIGLYDSELKHLMIHVKNIPPFYDHDKLALIFSRCGQVEFIRMKGLDVKGKKTAVVRFKSFTSVNAAIGLYKLGVLMHKIIVSRFL